MKYLKKPIYITLAALSLSAIVSQASYAADDSQDRDNSISEQIFLEAVNKSFMPNNPDEMKRFSDPTLKICNETADKPSPKQAADIMARERATIKLPANGKYMGDWTKGIQWVEGAHGGRIGFPGFADADNPAKPNGANCYACHAIDPNFPQNGNMGNDLTNYGKIRGNSEAIAKYTYEKIYNAKAYMACSLMPRFGHGEGHLLTAEQIADITAFLLHPDSPVNNPKKEGAYTPAH